MRNVSVKYHVVSNATQLHNLPLAEIKALYTSSGINLQITEGEAIPADPKFSALRDYDGWVRRFRETDTYSGHLIIGLGDRYSRNGIAGELLDMDQRGVAVVYMHSTYILQNGEDGVLQTAVHELGHMMHLSHMDRSATFHSAMDQAKDRTGSTILAWEAAEDEARAKEEASGKHAYLQRPPIQPPCFPLAYPARMILNENSDQYILPWGGQYDCPDNGANDIWTTGTSLRLIPERDHHLEGGPFAFTIRFQNQGNRPLQVPSHMGPEFDTLQLIITRPNGTRYYHRPRSLTCASGHQIVKPDEEIVRSFCTSRGPNGAVFPESGRYVVSAIFPGAGAASMPIEVEVKKRKDGPLTKERFRKFIAKGAAGSPAMLRQLDDALAGKDILDTVSRPYLALVRSKSVRDKAKAIALRSIALAKNAPSSVRHAAITSEVHDLAASNKITKVSLQQIIKKHLTCEVDQYLATQLEEFYL
ncbi:MAG: hypothetical protein EBU46_07490 [Nitrosomonadaceae bacterium]|nr:hypothetical protein [Nitrosomonadaceae bacterium]